MAVLAKPINRISVIKRQESQEFVREFNQNKVTNDFLESCKKAGKLFGENWLYNKFLGRKNRFEWTGDNHWM